MPTQKAKKMWFLAGTAIAGILLFVVFGNVPVGWNFRNILWGPAHLLLQGKSPYDVDSLFGPGVANALWMPVVIGLFCPPGFLPLQQASNLWWVLSLAGMLLLTLLVMRNRDQGILFKALLVSAGLLYPPVLAHLMLGQFSIFSILIFLLVVFFRRKMPDLLSAFLVIAASTKPQLSFLFLPGLLFHKNRTEGFQRTFRYLLKMAGVILVLLVPLFILSPGWYGDFLQ